MKAFCIFKDTTENKIFCWHLCIYLPGIFKTCILCTHRHSHTFPVCKHWFFFHSFLSLTLLLHMLFYWTNNFHTQHNFAYIFKSYALREILSFSPLYSFNSAESIVIYSVNICWINKWKEGIWKMHYKPRHC